MTYLSDCLFVAIYSLSLQNYNKVSFNSWLRAFSPKLTKEIEEKYSVLIYQYMTLCTIYGNVSLISISFLSAFTFSNGYVFLYSDQPQQFLKIFSSFPFNCLVHIIKVRHILTLVWDVNGLTNWVLSFLNDIGSV